MSMDKSILTSLVEKQLSQRQIAKELNCSQGSVKHWLKKFGLKTFSTSNFTRTSNQKIGTLCKLCDKETIGSRKICSSCRTKLRRHRNKERAVQLKGGKCEICKWVGNIVAFVFHHLDPTIKEFGIGSCSNKSWDSILTELDKCQLLCANCHLTIHSSRDEKFLEEANKCLGGENGKSRGTRLRFKRHGGSNPL